MERLTEYLGAFAWGKTPVAKHGERIPQAPCGYDCIGSETGNCNGCWYSEIITRLAAYEDTGMEPEEVKQIKLHPMWLLTFEDVNHLMGLAQAEKAGRLLVLPCKVGDKVWVIMENREIYSFVVRGISMSATCDDTILRLSNSFQWGSNLGKTWFLTRQEAEEALRKEADNG